MQQFSVLKLSVSKICVCHIDLSFSLNYHLPTHLQTISKQSTIIMSDLSVLFSPQLNRSSLPLNSSWTNSPKKETSTNSKAPSVKRSQGWSLNDLESSLRKGVKKELQMPALKQELTSFGQKQKQQYMLKAIFLASFILFWHFFLQLDSRIIFHLGLFVIVRVIPSLPFEIAQQKLIVNSLKSISWLAYAALFYYILKWTTGMQMGEFNLPLTFYTIVFTSVYAFLEYVRHIYKLSVEHLAFKHIAQKQILNKIAVFFVLLLERGKFMRNMATNIFAITFITFGFGLVLVAISGSNLQQLFKLKYFLHSFLAFTILQLLQSIIYFIDAFFCIQIRIVRNKMPVYLALLRLSGSSPYRRIVQHKCLVNLVAKMQHMKCFLSTQTCKSLIYNTYMDIFNQYASIELQRALGQMANELSYVGQCHAVINSQKKIIEDLFIPVRKIKAHINQFCTVANAMHSLQQVILLMRAIALSDQQAYHQKEAIRVQSRIIDLLEMIEEKMTKICSYNTLNQNLRTQLLFNKMRLTGWIFSMRKGWV